MKYKDNININIYCNDFISHPNLTKYFFKILRRLLNTEMQKLCKVSY